MMGCSRRLLCMLLLGSLCVLLPMGQCGAEGKAAAYVDYILPFDEANTPEKAIVLCSADALGGEQNTIADVAAVTLTNEGDCAAWRFSVPETGFYILQAEYYALAGTNSTIELEILIDGQLPFLEAEQLSLTRLFKDERDTMISDALGNDLRSPQAEIFTWQTRAFFDVNGYVDGEYYFYLREGEHTLSVILTKESLAIHALTFTQPEAVPDYDAYLAAAGEPAATEGGCIILEAEKTLSKTSTMLYPISDRADALTYPSDTLSKKLNTIGGENWTNPDQTITWEVTVPASGWYSIAWRYRQNYLRGMETYRDMQLDGETLFGDMNRIGFAYGVSWQVKTLGDGEPLYFYLEEGTHTLSMTPTTGELAPLMQLVSKTVATLNTLYRRIIMITSVNPDQFRDYYLYESVPGLTDILLEEAAALRKVVRTVETLTASSGTEAAALDRMADQLESLAELPDSIPSRLSTFRDNIITISTWMLEIQAQALQLDRIFLIPLGAEMPQTSAALFQQLDYQLKAFTGSFTYDYESVGAAAQSETEIKVWISSGRDQAEMLKELIDSRFTPDTGISVNLAIVQTGLMQAVVAGKGPDVAVMIGHGDAVNYAIRGAVLALEEFDGFDELIEEYMPGAMIPYEYNGHYYGLPNTQNFYMMFYRTDVLEELGVDPPRTWDGLLQAAETIQRNNMNIGLPYVALDAYASISTGIGGTSLFPTLLLQNGLSLYTDEGLTTLDQPEALNAFQTWVNYYSQYGFPLYKDDFNRFRSGEMPIVITNYTFYTQLEVAAPEIRNLWKMTLIPGTVQADGSVDHATAASGTSGIILSNTNQPDASWEFLKWWNSAEIQAEYGMQIENVMGAAGRYNPANVEAMKRLPWSGSVRSLILTQWESVKEIQELPGSYYVSRNIDNAFKSVYYDYENYREALNYWNRQINNELIRKRQEYALD